MNLFAITKKEKSKKLYMEEATIYNLYQRLHKLENEAEPLK